MTFSTDDFLDLILFLVFVSCFWLLSDMLWQIMFDDHIHKFWPFDLCVGTGVIFIIVVLFII